jgi:hypothetical protein
VKQLGIDEGLARWAEQYEEWLTIRAELTVKGGDVTAWAVSAEQRRRAFERGTTLVAVALDGNGWIELTPAEAAHAAKDVAEFLAMCDE